MNYVFFYFFTMFTKYRNNYLFLFADKLYVYSCKYNYRSDHCMYKSSCKDAEVSGVSVLHGSRSAFHSDKLCSFKAIFQAFSRVRMNFSL